MLTDWKSSESDGTLPLEFEAGQVQFRRFLHYEADLRVNTENGGLGIQTQTGIGKFHIKLLFNGTLFAEWEVQLTIAITALGMIFTWQIVREEITTLYLWPHATNLLAPGSGLTAPISVTNLAGSSGLVEDANNVRLTTAQWSALANPSWDRVVNGSVPASEFGTMVPGGGSGTMVGVAIIDAFWESPLYHLNLPIGTKLDVVHDGWGLGVSTRPEWQWRFLAARDTEAYMLDREGALIGAGVLNANIHMSRTWISCKTLQRLGIVEDASHPVIWKDGTNRLFLCARQGGEWRVWFSDYDGIDMAPLPFGVKDPDREDEQVSYLTANFDNVDVKPYRGGVVVSAQLEGKVYFLESPDGIIAGPLKEVGGCNNDRCYLTVSKDESRIEITDGREVHYRKVNSEEWADISAKYAT